MDRSIAETVPDCKWICVGVPVLRMHEFVSFTAASTIAPRPSAELHPQIGCFPLKSPSRRNGVNSHGDRRSLFQKILNFFF